MNAPRDLSAGQELTEREADIMDRISRGGRYKDIEGELELTTSQVHYAIRCSLIKLGALTLSHGAVLYAQRRDS